jgi:hypothetical protein
MTILSTRFNAACSALVAGAPGFGLFFALGMTGLGELSGDFGIMDLKAIGEA